MAAGSAVPCSDCYDTVCRQLAHPLGFATGKRTADKQSPSTKADRFIPILPFKLI
jgi:hypothetical protein